MLQRRYLGAPSLLSSQSEATVSPQEGQVAVVSHPPPCVAEIVFQQDAANKTFPHPAPTCRAEIVLQAQQDKKTGP